IVVMNEGRVEQVGTPEEIYERPGSRFVADFIGRSNILDGRMREGVFVTDFGAVIQLPDAAGPRENAGALAVRPESIRLHVPPGEPGWNRIHGKVESLEYFGATVVAYIRVSDAKVLTARLAAQE